MEDEEKQDYWFMTKRKGETPKGAPEMPFGTARR
jgi:hypothetical protein